MTEVASLCNHHLTGPAVQIWKVSREQIDHNNKGDGHEYERRDHFQRISENGMGT